MKQPKPRPCHELISIAFMRATPREGLPILKELDDVLHWPSLIVGSLGKIIVE